MDEPRDYHTGTSPVVQWLRLCTSNAGGVGSIPGRRTNIPHGVQHSQKKREIIILTEVNQTEKDKYYMISLTCGL